MNELHKRITDLVAPYENLALECDGMTRVIHHLLKEVGIEHTVKVGPVRYKDVVVPLHYWIELADRGPATTVVDYRLQMWTDDEAPHGVFTFREASEKEARYWNSTSKSIELETPPAVLAVLMSHTKETK